MYPFAPLRKTYSTVLSPLSSDEICYDDQDPASKRQTQSSKPSPRTIHRHSFLIRLIIFVLLEFGFIAVVSTALRKPIILHLSFTTTEVKGAVTAISILWHALAIYAVKDILLNIFSAEWIRQDDGSQNLTLQELDSVSRLTTGFVDQAKHFVSKRATPSFRLGFLSLLLLILLNGLGPSAIGVNLVPFDYPCNISVANLLIGAAPPYNETENAAHRARSIVELEIVENFTTSGYLTRQPNTLIPWPSSNSISEDMTMTYESDIIQYNFSCSWNIPSMTNFTKFGTMSLMAPDDIWEVYAPITAEQTVWADPSVFPLQQVQPWFINGVHGYGSDETGTNSLMSFLFVGRNASFVGGNVTWPPFLNLEDTPSLLIPCNTTPNRDFDTGVRNPCDPLLVSALVCNPQLQILPATINATLSSLEATIFSGGSTVKNIPTGAANIIFSTSLFEVTSQKPLEGPLLPIFYRLFLPQPLDLKTIKPFPLEQINQNMNNVLASSAKAYLGGYMPQYKDAFTTTNFSTVNTSATMEVQKMALVGSQLFLVASSVIVALLVVQLVVLVAITKPNQLVGFELENIVKMLQRNCSPPSSEA